MRSRLLQNAVRALPFTSLQKPLSNTSHDISIVQECPELPGGTPLSLCKESRDTDLFQITSVELSKQPVYLEDFVSMNIYGVFSDTWYDRPYHNATMSATMNCGSHCDMYETPPEYRGGESFHYPFCNITQVEQPRGHYHGETCPPVPGPALVTGYLYAWRWIMPTSAWYNLTFDAKTAEGDRIFCLTAEVCLHWEDPDDNREGPQGPWTNCTWPR